MIYSPFAYSVSAEIANDSAIIKSRELKSHQRGLRSELHNIFKYSDNVKLKRRHA